MSARPESLFYVDALKPSSIYTYVYVGRGSSSGQVSSFYWQEPPFQWFMALMVASLGVCECCRSSPPLEPDRSLQAPGSHFFRDFFSTLNAFLMLTEGRKWKKLRFSQMMDNPQIMFISFAASQRYPQRYIHCLKTCFPLCLYMGDYSLGWAVCGSS